LALNFASTVCLNTHQTEPQDGLENTTMNATRATEQSQDSQRHYRNLDDRYGKIGISAVAAAVHHQGEQRNIDESRFLPLESD
jgi:hypothetical protein